MNIQPAWIMGLVAGIAVGDSALAQQASSGAQTASTDTLQEVVVTATRRTETVHDIPLSVTAVTSEQVEKQGLKTAQDLVNVVTSLRISPVNGGDVAGQPDNPDVAIRGIESVTGAATTGIYIDDVPLQQRNVGGPTGGGVVFPQLFDLDRVEVLKGPQGTLYGGSSEGGTIRFITPQPNFTQQTLNARVEGSHTDNGDPNYEAGVTVGGPLIDNMLAARVSGWYRRDGGYIDHVSAYTGNVLSGGENTNSEQHRAIHAALAWKPADAATLTLSYLYFNNYFRDSDEYWASIPQFQANLGPDPGTLYTYGPYRFGPYKSGQNTNIGKNFYTSDAQLSPLLSPHNNSLSIPSLTFDYAFGPVNLKSVTAYSVTINKGSPNFSYVDTASRSQTPLEAPYNNLPNNSGYIATLPNYSSVFVQHSRITSGTEELRLSSNTPQSRLSWVAGAFFQRLTLTGNGVITANTGDLAAAALFGAPSAAALPPPLDGIFGPLNGVGLVSPQTLHEDQEAVFAEGTFKITDPLRLTVGLRYTRDKFDYNLQMGGALFGFAPGELFTVSSGSVTQSPVTPKIGLQYVLNSDANFYVNAAKGFRPGGINSTISPGCQDNLTAAGFPGGVPSTFGSDSLWSYEAGAKLRTWGGKASIEGSIFHIDWNGVQTPINLACGASFTTNAAKAVSQGADVQSAFLLFPGFTFTVDVAYTDAHYTSTVSTGPGNPTLISNGDELPYTPKWTGNASVEYRWQIASRPTFVRADYGYLGKFVQGSGPGDQGYQPDSYRLPGTKVVNARAGMTFAKIDVSAFVNNLTNSQDLASLNGMAAGPGRVNCLNGAACTSYTTFAQGAVLSTFRPRTIGMAVGYKY